MADVRISKIIISGEELRVISVSDRRRTWPEDLTGAEIEVADLVLEGRSNAEIAELRGTSARTVANQVVSVFRKLAIQSRAELVAWSRATADAPET